MYAGFAAKEAARLIGCMDGENGMKQGKLPGSGKSRLLKGKRAFTAIVCLALIFALLPTKSLALSLERDLIFVDRLTSYADGSVKSLDIRYTYPTLASSEKCNVVLNKDIGSGGDLYSTYGHAYSTFEESLTGIGGVITYDPTWATVSSGQQVSITTNFAQGKLPLTANAKYYVYMWAYYSSHYYPDELLAILEVRDGRLYYTTDVSAESADVTVTEHQIAYALSSDKKTITETCSHCSHSKTLTLTASSATYTGSAYTGAQLSDTAGFLGTVGAIKYYSVSTSGATSGGTPLSSAPVNAGHYYAAVSLGGKTAVASFSITLAAHSVTVLTDGNGTASANLTSAVMGTSITLTATPNNGYVFDAWVVQSGSITVSSNAFSMPNSNVSVKATFKPASYGITYLDQGGGAFSGTHDTGAPASYTFGTGATLKGASKTNYFFDGWFENSACTGTSVSSVSTAATGARTFYAKWRAYTYTITASPSSLTFGPKSANYRTVPDAQTVTVTNTGNRPVILTPPTSTTTYAIVPQGDWSASVAPNGTRSFTVQPIKTATQTAGSYPGTFTVSTDHGTSAQATAGFTVGSALSVSIPGDLAIVAGNSTTLTANAAGGTGTYIYQWSGGGISDTTRAVTVSPTVTTEYTVTVTDQGDSSKSASATVTVTAQSNHLAVSPTSHNFGTARTGYTVLPAAKTFTVTYTGNFWVTLNQPTASDYMIGTLSRSVLNSANPTATFTVQPKAALPAGPHNETITVNTLLGAASAACNVSFTVSDTAETVAITQQPENVTMAVGSPASFMVAATGDPAPAYQWQLNTGTGWADISGAIDAAYTTGNITPDMQGNQYRCIISNYTIQQNSVTTDPATLTLTLPLTISPRSTFTAGSAPANLTATVGENTGVKFTTDFGSAMLNETALHHGVEFDGEDGSIVLRFRQNYLNTLAPGSYALHVMLRSGAYADGTIIVLAPAPIPSTGDDSKPVLWAGLVLLACAGLVVNGIVSRRKRRTS